MAVTLPGASRIAAVAIAVLGAIDPSWVIRRPQPVPVEVIGDDESRVAAVRRELARRLGQAVALDASRAPAALVVVGGNPLTAVQRFEGIPISLLGPGPESPNVRIVRADDPAPVRTGWAATMAATFEARGMSGAASAIVLESAGVELSRLEHKWTADLERYTAALRYTPPRDGASTVTIRALPLDREAIASDNTADVRLAVAAGRLKILVHEPRPSWNATFVRRALEDDDTFDVSAATQASKRLSVRAGSPPAALTADALAAFDAVVVGAPEDMTAPEVEALRLFARRRGGAVVLLPDRRPSGPYVELIPSPGFDEVLIEQAAALSSVEGGRLRASEMAVYRMPERGAANVLASAELAKVPRPVVLEWLLGEGRVLLSGALDAWRYRASDDDGFSRFWRARIAEAAQAALPRAAVSIVPGVPRAGEEVGLHVRLRPTEFDVAGTSTRLPPLRARVADASGRLEVVRLWPSSGAGAFRGRVMLPRAGSYVVHVSTDSGIDVEETLSVAADSRHPVEDADSARDARQLVAASTGGLVVSEGDLGPLERHLRSLTAGDAARTVRPWRTAWMVMAFVALLSTEWAMRRRRGEA